MAEKWPDALKSGAVFAGPSLSACAKHMAEKAGFVLLPPARRGDVLAYASTFKILILLDGYFDWTLSVSHTEIKQAIRDGCAVYGASSLGALRAAEAKALGMVGIGRIFNDYSEGRVIDDDEVALLHAPKELGYVEVTIPLVNLRYTLQELAKHDLLILRQMEVLIDIFKSIFFKIRDWKAIHHALGLHFGVRLGARISKLFQDRYINQKQIDGEHALRFAISESNRVHRPPRHDKPAVVFISRYCALSGLDDLPLTVVAAVRSNFRANPISIGSADSLKDAMRNAHAEAVELASIETMPSESLRATFRELACTGGAIDPVSIQGCRKEKYHENRPIEWVKALDLKRKDTVLIPWSALAFSHDHMFDFSTNGMGVAQSSDAATLHALFEVIERHIVSTVAFGVNGCLDMTKLELFDPCDRLPVELQLWLSARCGGVFPLWIENSLGVHVFMTFISISKQTSSVNDGCKVSVGYACSDNIHEAFDRSIHEALRVHIAYISGARPGLKAGHHGQRAQKIKKILESIPRTGSFRYFKKNSLTDVSVRLRHISETLKENGFPRILSYSYPSIDKHTAVKVIIPGFQFNHLAF